MELFSAASDNEIAFATGLEMPVIQGLTHCHTNGQTHADGQHGVLAIPGSLIPNYGGTSTMLL